MRLVFGRPKIGLALSGGGPKGVTHIGVLKVLEKNKIPIDYIAGTSAGAIAGAFYSSCKNASLVEKYILDKNWLQLLTIFIDPSFKQGIAQGKQLQNFLKDFLTENRKFEDLLIPFKAVSVDLDKAETVTFDKGLLIPAILASCGAPLLFSPAKHDNKTLVDGGLINPVPVEVVKKMGADIVIAVDLYNLPKLNDVEIGKLGLFGVVKRSLDISLRQLAKHDLEKADIVINPAIQGMDWSELLQKDKRIKAIREGEIAMNNALPQLHEKLYSSNFINIFKRISGVFKRFYSKIT